MEVSDLIGVYTEVVRGYTETTVDGATLYLRHPSLTDHSTAMANYDFVVKSAKAKGLPSEAEQVKAAIDGGYWSEDSESKMNLIRTTIENLHRTKARLLYPSQKLDIQKQIDRNSAVLASYSQDRSQFVGYTIESYANSRFYDNLIINATFEDTSFNRRAFSDAEDYYDLVEDAFQSLTSAYTRVAHYLSPSSLRLTSAAGFFQNLVYLSSNAQDFYGVATSKCTKHQIDLLLYGKIFRETIKSAAEGGEPINDEIVNDPEKLVQYVDNLSSGNRQPRKAPKGGGREGEYAVTSHVGATKEDLDQMGVKVEKVGGKSLLQLAREKGGKLEKNDYLSAREQS